jgi:hypothetical protein
MRDISELNYNLICTNCTKHCNYTLLDLSFYRTQGIKTWKCNNFIPDTVFDRETLKNQVFVEGKQIEKHYERLRKNGK